MSEHLFDLFRLELLADLAPEYLHYLSIRRENREFARLQAKKHKEILAQVEAELNLPKSLRHYATKAMDNE